MNRCIRTICLLLSFCMLLSYAPARALEKPSVTMQVTPSQSPLAVGDHLEVEITGQNTADLALMVVSPDSKQQFYYDLPATVPLLAEGLYVLIGYGANTTDPSHPEFERCMTAAQAFQVSGISTQPTVCLHTEIPQEGEPSYYPFDGGRHFKHIPMHYSCTCGAVDRNEIIIRTESHVAQGGVCIYCGDSVDPFANIIVSDALIEKLLRQANSATVNMYSDFCEMREDSLFYQACTEALKIITDPIGGTYDAVSGGVFSAQEKEVLQRAVVEMLYGVEYGNSTYTELSQLVDDAGSFIGDFSLNVISEVSGALSNSLSDSMTAKAESLYYAMSVTGRTPEQLLTATPESFSAEAFDELIGSYDEYLKNYSLVEGTEAYAQQMRVRDDLAELKKLRDNSDHLNSFNNTIDYASVGFDAVMTAITITVNYLAAKDQVNKMRESEAAALYAIASDRLEKIEILTHLMSQLDQKSALYDACKVVRSDIQKDLQGLHSTDQRKTLVESGKYIMKFGCGTAVSVKVVAEKAAGKLAGNILTTTAIATVVSDLVTGGSISEAVDYAETIENLVFVHHALESIDTEKMSFFEAELYYTLAKKELDYASEINLITHSGSWLSSSDEEEKLNLDMDIVRAQSNLLDAQNSIRAEYFQNNGVDYEPENKFDPAVISKYKLAKYDFTVGNESIPAYANSDPMGAFGDPSPFRWFGWTLDKNTKYEIISIFVHDAVTYVEVESSKGEVSYVRVADIPNGWNIVDKKYSLNIGDDVAMPLYLVKETGFLGAVFGEPDFIYHSSAYAGGDYEILRAVKYADVYYYKVRDRRGSEGYLRASDVKNYLDGNKIPPYDPFIRH